MRVNELPIYVIAILGVWGMLLASLSAFQVISLSVIKDFRLLPRSVAMLLFGYFFLQFCNDLTDGLGGYSIGKAGLFFGNMKLHGICFLMVLFSVISAVTMVETRKFIDSHLGVFAIKRSVDLLPIGVLCYDFNGNIRLANNTMNDICYKLKWRYVSDGNEFKELIYNEKLPNGAKRIERKGEPVIRFFDNEVFAFRYLEYMQEGELIREIIAYDVTKEYEKSESLRQKNAQLEYMNNRMRRLNEDITQITIEKEILSTKIRIHDELGEILLTSRRYLKGQLSDSEKQEIRTKLKRNAHILRTQGKERREDEYVLMRNTAKDVGVTLKVIGTLPEGTTNKHICSTAMHECITNVIRHANGDELYVRVDEANDEFRIEFTNNGVQPKGPIKETGGLMNLRNMVEDAGGRMSVSSDRYFRLILMLKKGEEDD